MGSSTQRQHCEPGRNHPPRAQAHPRVGHFLRGRLQYSHRDPPPKSGRARGTPTLHPDLPHSSTQHSDPAGFRVQPPAATTTTRPGDGAVLCVRSGLGSPFVRRALANPTKRRTGSFPVPSPRHRRPSRSPHRPTCSPPRSRTGAPARRAGPGAEGGEPREARPLGGDAAAGRAGRRAGPGASGRTMWRRRRPGARHHGGVQ